MIYFNTLLILAILVCSVYLIYLQTQANKKPQIVIEPQPAPIVQSTRKSRVIKRDDNDQIIPKP